MVSGKNNIPSKVMLFRSRRLEPFRMLRQSSWGNRANLIFWREPHLFSVIPCCQLISPRACTTVKFFRNAINSAPMHHDHLVLHSLPALLCAEPFHRHTVHLRRPSCLYPSPLFDETITYIRSRYPSPVCVSRAEITEMQNVLIISRKQEFKKSKFGGNV